MTAIPVLFLPLYALSLPNMNTSLVISVSLPLSLPFSLTLLHSLTHRHTHRQTDRQTLLFFCTSPTISNMTPCLCLWPDPCVIDGILPDASTHIERCTHTHTHTHTDTRIAHSTTQSHTARPWWLILADPQWPIKRACGLTSCLAALIYWVGSPVSPPLPLALITFPFSPLSFPLLFLILSSLSPSSSLFLTLVSLFLSLSLSLSSSGGKKGCGHLQPTDVGVVGFY